MKYANSLKILDVKEISLVCGGSNIIDDDTIFGAALGCIGIVAVVLLKMAIDTPKAKATRT